MTVHHMNMPAQLLTSICFVARSATFGASSAARCAAPSMRSDSSSAVAGAAFATCRQCSICYVRSEIPTAMTRKPSISQQSTAMPPVICGMSYSAV